jgi:hypothetical protein
MKVINEELFVIPLSVIIDVSLIIFDQDILLHHVAMSPPIRRVAQNPRDAGLFGLNGIEKAQAQILKIAL